MVTIGFNWAIGKLTPAKATPRSFFVDKGARKERAIGRT
jgi:hypothetical protein